MSVLHGRRLRPSYTSKTSKTSGSHLLAGYLLAFALVGVVSPTMSRAQGGQTGAPAVPSTQTGGAASQPTPPPVSPEAQRAIAQFQNAERLQKSGKNAAARDAYKAFLKQAVAAKMDLGAQLAGYEGMYHTSRALNDTKGMESSLTQISKLSPTNPGIWLELATLYVAEERYPEARTNAEKSLKLKPRQEQAAQAHFILGAAAFARKDLAVAEEEYRTSVKLAPTNPQAQFNLMLTLNALKRFKEALAIGQKLIQLVPQMVPARMLMAQIYQEGKDLTHALAAYEAVLKYDPKNTPALYNRALICQQLSRTDEAITSYLAYLDQAPKDFIAQYNVGLLYMSLKNYVAARGHLSSAVQIRPKDVKALDSLALCEREEGFNTGPQKERAALLNRAVAHFKQAMALDPRDEQIPNQLAGLLMRDSRFQDALALFQQEEEAQPDNPEVYKKLTRVYTAMRDLDKAIAEWKKYRSRKPNDPTSYGEVADIYEVTTRWKEASEERIQQIQRDPKNGDAKIDLGREYRELQQLAYAEAEFKLVLDLDSEGKDVGDRERPYVIAERRNWRAKAWRALSELADKKGDMPTAIQYLQNIEQDTRRYSKVEHRSPDAQIFLDIATLYERNKQPDLARKEYQALIENRPFDPKSYSALGDFEERIGNTDDAVTAYQRASERATDPVEYVIREAKVYQKKQMLDKALEIYNDLLKKYPKDARVATPLGELLEQTKDDTRALKIYEALLVAKPNDPTLMEKKAVVLTRLKRYPEARAVREKLMGRQYGVYQAYVNVGYLYQLEGHPEAYLTWLKGKVEVYPNVVPAMAALVDAYVQQKQEDAGWKVVRAIAAKHAAELDVQDAYIMVLLQHKKATEAIEVRQQLVTRNPKDLDLLTKLASLLVENNQSARAEKLLGDFAEQTAVPLAVRTQARRTLALHYYNTGKYAQAIVNMKKVLAAEPDDLSTIFALGRVYVDAGRELDAIELYQQRSHKNGTPPVLQAHFHAMCGDILSHKSDRTAAQAEYETALKLDPRSDEATTGIQRLNNKNNSQNRPDKPEKSNNP